MKTFLSPFGKPQLLPLAIFCVLFLGCNSESGSEPLPPPDPGQEFTFYAVDDNTLLLTYSALYGLSHPDPGVELPMHFDMDVYLQDRKRVQNMLELYYLDPEIVDKPVTLKPITNIEVMALSDYDEQHPEGTSLNDLLDIIFLGGPAALRMELTEYFAAYGAVEWKDDFVFGLRTKYAPPQENWVPHGLSRPPYRKDGIDTHGFEVLVYLTLEDGTKLEIAPVQTTKE